MPVAATIMVSKPWVPLFDLSDAEMNKMMENVSPREQEDDARVHL
eukprot:CAMPEP_0118718988 /NCGR_PEP_ID=MMETSP0800-20121206/29152_1 /TAXON_ID=210618 ORGANISM="Striatella unipunctata, Strain CCMP2910" /NCGR_SAMPLE_ID=MMETSP0800 /ASSEMBLY_ACC=CAM_ASM_000638 /LENGTH=44 /DNA_ID= /DNA_START= /DNA_END= /DNA_ORIENTATION=